MTSVDEVLSALKVVKRDGKKVDFNGAKIVVAIKKGFDSVVSEDIEAVYTEEDIQKVYKEVLNRIEKEYADQSKIKIESIQDMIEEQLDKDGYTNVYTSFKNYRERRNQSRKLFSDEKRLHKFLKTIEGLGLKSASEEDTKRENANIDGNSAMGTMLQYGSTISKEFTKSYLMKPKFAEAHDSGMIHIHDMDFFAMGTTTCCQIDLSKLFKNGFSTGHGHLRTPNDIMSYGALAAIAIQSNQNDQHGGQSIPAFDYFLAPGVLKTFKKQFKQMIYDLLDYSDFINFVSMDKVIKEIDKLDSIEFDISTFYDLAKGSEQVEKIFRIAHEKAIQKTNRFTYQAMEAFVHNLNTMHSRAGAQVPFSSINLGTDISPEGRMVTKNYLLATDAGLGKGETPIFPISIFKVKEGLNYNEGDPSYDLFQLACKVSAKRLFPNFSFLDAPFNLQFYNEGDWNSEVTYMGCRTRVLGNVVDPDKAVVGGRGNLSFTTINLPRIGLKYGSVNDGSLDLDGFFEELEHALEMARDQLFERFELQCNKKIYNFPFLLDQGVWLDSEKLKPTDKLKRILKHGTLSIGFIGLAECLKALIGKHHGENEEAQKLGLRIIKFMRDKTDEYSEKYNLNYTLLATPAEGIAGRFTAIDRTIYGNIKGVTDKEYYTNSFHVPVYYDINIAKKINLEAPYHSLTNAGHITYIELDGDASDNVEAFEKIVRIMKEAGIGYGAINHPVDRDPVCGYVGIIGDTCPRCGRRAYEGVPVEVIKSLDCCE